MYSLVFLTLVSLVASLVLTPLTRNLARRLGFVDHPDGGRHLHAQAVPRVGGIPILLSYLIAIGLLLTSPLHGGVIARGLLPLASQVLPATGLVFLVGLLDDLRGVKPWQKFAVQLAAALGAFLAGVQITAVAGFEIPTWLSLPVTLIWLAGCSNAFNLIDGVDGLAAGAAVFATATILLGALLNGNLALALATVPLAGALLGFLRYNFNPASIFLGDCGSLTLGFLLGCYAIIWSHKSATVLGMTAPLLALALPLLDTTLAMARRFVRGQPIHVGDFAHIHHRLLARGLTPRRVALLLYAACGVTASLSLLASVGPGQFRGLVILLFCAVAWIGCQQLGYIEFSVAGRMLLDGTLRQHLSQHIELQTLREALARADSTAEKWFVIREACRNFGFVTLECSLPGRRWTETLGERNGDPLWALELPLGQNEFLRLWRPIGAAPHPTVLAPLAEVLHTALSRNLSEDCGVLSEKGDSWRGTQ